MATIRKKGDFQWHVQIRRAGFDSQTKTFETRAEAENWAKVIESEMIRGVFVPRVAAEKTTLRELVERYIAEVTPTHRGHASEALRLRALAKRSICQKFVAALKAEDFSKFRDKRLKEPASRHDREKTDKALVKTVAPATVHRELGLFQQVLEHARREWGIHLSDNPLRLVKRPKLENGRDRRLSDDEEERLMEAIGECQTPWLKPAVLLALETGMRQGELLELCWKHVDLTVPSAHLPKTKNGDARTVPLSKKAVKILKSLPRSLSGKVLPTSASAIKQAWARAVDRAEIENLHFHDLRHEATSRLAEKIPNVLMLAAITGHRDLQMLKRYYHPRPGELAKLLG